MAVRRALPRAHPGTAQRTGARDPPAAPAARPGNGGGMEPVVIADGLEITLEPGRAGLSAEQVRAFARGVMALYGQVRGSDDEQHNKKEDNHA